MQVSLASHTCTARERHLFRVNNTCCSAQRYMSSTIRLIIIESGIITYADLAYIDSYVYQVALGKRNIAFLKKVLKGKNYFKAFQNFRKSW